MQQAPGDTCPKCGGRMEEGFVLDHGHYDSRKVAQWVEGPPEKSFWKGLELKDRERLPLSTMRCERCGFLEFYARPAPAPS